MNKNIKIVKRSVNSKLLFDKINEVVYEAMTTLGVRWTSEQNRNAFAVSITDFLMGLAEEGSIQQFKVICDKRNNKTFSSDAKEFCFEVWYKQPHCLNMTKIEYHVKNK